MENEVILIQGAMDIEIEYLLEQLEERKNEKIADYDFYTGKINDVKVVISKTLIGVVNATMATTIGIMNFRPNIIINQGIAGAHREDIHTGDIIIGEKCCNINAYDMPNKNKGQGSEPFEWKPSNRAKDIQNANKALVNTIEKTLKANTSKQIYRGRLGSGDVFNREIDRIFWINNLFQNDCEDMESIGVYSVCNKFHVPCVGIRIISNNEILLERLEETKATELQRILVDNLQHLVKE
ncbi:MAG: 5'-methylthioadenosine/S-adenosylhomocysteine nucleosidase [Clostridia bacterium]|nr:5'-methylthioadenosine/S-adenosylhomocysteine nucleosidase [Clostridia bacterium]